MPWLVCEVGNDVAAYAYASPFRTRAGYRWTAELTVYVHPAFHRRRVGRALYSALPRCLSAQGDFMAVAIISLPNAASVSLHESMGFRRTGVLEGIGHKFGRWMDDDVRQMEIQPMPADPPGPIPSIHLLGTLEGDSSMESGAAPLKA
jgi:phosphinothricin acetyltransferase